MIAGGKCSYPLGNQLAQAVDFLHTHRVLLVTITIGGDDVLGCIMRDGSIINGCPEQGLAAIGHNLPYILSELRAAAGPNVPSSRRTTSTRSSRRRSCCRAPRGRRSPRSPSPIPSR